MKKKGCLGCAGVLVLFIIVAIALPGGDVPKVSSDTPQTDPPVSEPTVSEPEPTKVEISPIASTEQQPATSAEQQVESTDVGRKFLKTKLAELDAFKSQEKFHRLGFGVGGPYHRWLKSFPPSNEAEFSLYERIAAGDLEQLGLKYLKTKGQENNYTDFARKEIMLVIQGQAPTGDHPPLMPSPVEEKPNLHGAWAYMQLFVEERLKNPKSADFPFGGFEHVTPLGNNRYRVRSYVDAENSFGGTVRTQFEGVIKEVGDKWELESFSFLE